MTDPPADAPVDAPVNADVAAPRISTMRRDILSAYAASGMLAAAPLARDSARAMQKDGLIIGVGDRRSGGEPGLVSRDEGKVPRIARQPVVVRTRSSHPA